MADARTENRGLARRAHLVRLLPYPLPSAAAPALLETARSDKEDPMDKHRERGKEEVELHAPETKVKDLATGEKAKDVKGGGANGGMSGGDGDPPGRPA
jgi:hypothetical protein